MKVKYPPKRSYAESQHALICRAVKCSPDPKAPGSTAYEAVCVLLTKLDVAQYTISKLRSAESKRVLKFLKAHHDSNAFSVLYMYGTK